MSTPRTRQPPGTPTGGQFAETAKGASGIDLAGPATREPTDDDIDYFYRDGDASACFADTVAARTGWPVVVASDGPEGVAGWAHAGVRTPDGFIIDAEGARPEQDWIDSWEIMVDMWGSDSDDYDGELAGVYPATDHGWTADGFFVPHSEDDQQRADQIVDSVLGKAHDDMSVDGDPVTDMAPGLPPKTAGLPDVRPDDWGDPFDGGPDGALDAMVNSTLDSKLSRAKIGFDRRTGLMRWGAEADGLAAELRRRGDQEGAEQAEAFSDGLDDTAVTFMIDKNEVMGAARGEVTAAAMGALATSRVSKRGREEWRRAVGRSTGGYRRGLLTGGAALAGTDDWWGLRDSASATVGTDPA